MHFNSCIRLHFIQTAIFLTNQKHFPANLLQVFHFSSYTPFLFNIIIIPLLVQTAHIQHSTDTTKNNQALYRKNGMFLHAVIVFYLYSYALHAFNADYTGRTDAFFIHFFESTMDCAFRSLMRQEDNLHKTLFIGRAFLNHRSNAHAMLGKLSCNSAQHTRLILDPLSTWAAPFGAALFRAGI